VCYARVDPYFGDLLQALVEIERLSWTAAYIDWRPDCTNTFASTRRPAAGLLHEIHRGVWQVSGEMMVAAVRHRVAQGNRP
jgi:hypothetical protein